MANQGTIYVKLELDSTGFDKGMQSAGETAKNSGGILQSALGFATGGAILGGLSVLKDSIAGVAGSMISGNAEFERYQTQFGVLLGSTDAAKQRLAELAAFGASTPFELPQLVNADKVLQSFGIHSQEMLTIVGDVAAGTGASFEDMALLMGKFSAGSTGEVISRFQEMGVTTRDELAKMGIEFNNAGAMTTPVAEAMPILEQIMKDKFGGMMEAQSKTFEGMMSNLADWKDGTLRTLGEPIFEVIKDKLGVVLEFLSSPEVQQAITDFATALADGIGAAIDFISNVVIPAFTKAMDTIGPIIKTVIDAFSNGGQSSKELGEVLTFLGEVWNEVSEIIGLAAKLIQAIVVPIFNAIKGFLSEHSEEINRILSLAWSSLKTTIETALAVIKGVITAALQLINGDFSGAWETIKQTCATFVEGLGTLIKNGLDTILTFFGTSVDDIVKTITRLPGEMVSIGANIVDGIKSGISGSWSSFVSWVTGQLSGLKDEILSFFGIESPSRVMADEVGQPLILGIMQGMEESLPQLLSVASELGDKLIDTVRSATSGISSVIESAFSGEASIDRQLASNYDKLQKLSENAAQKASNALFEAEQKLREFANPKDAAEFFSLRSKQIMELAELQSQVDKATSEEEKDRIRHKMGLIESAHENELKALQERQSRGNSTLIKMAEETQKIFDNMLSDENTDRTAIDRVFNLLVQLNALIGKGPVNLGIGGALPPAIINGAQNITNGTTATAPGLTINQYITHPGSLIDEARMAMLTYQAVY